MGKHSARTYTLDYVEYMSAVSLTADGHLSGELNRVRTSYHKIV